MHIFGTFDFFSKVTSTGKYKDMGARHYSQGAVFWKEIQDSTKDFEIRAISFS